MVELKQYLDKNTKFLEEVFDLLKLNIEYSFNFVEISEENKKINFYNQVEHLNEKFNFFDFIDKYQNVSQCNSRLDAYIFTLNKIFSLDKMFTKNKNKVFIYKIGNSKSHPNSFFILQVNLEAYKRHITYDSKHNFLDFLFNQIFYKITHDFITERRSGLISSLGAKEIISLATKNFINSISMKFKTGDIDIFETINNISRMKYENGEAAGEIVITKFDSLVINNILKIDGDVSIKETRKIRKLLEGTNGNFSLVTDLEKVYGFGNKTFLKTLDDVFVIKILSSEHWELFYKERKLLKIVGGIPVFDKLMVEKHHFIEKLSNKFPDLLTWEKEKMWNLVEEVVSSGQGSLLVITEGYREEAMRLKIHSTVFKPFEMKSNLMLDFFKIDGAILMSPRRMCSSIGVILDGVLSEMGDSSRGARYNSALKYYDTQKDKYKMIIIIASEDGAVDIVG